MPTKTLSQSHPALAIERGALARVLCHLGRVERLSELGTRGPLLASAGAHSLFHCLFGRDAIRMALDLVDDFPRVAEATLLSLATLQGVRHDPRAEEEPGRIIHEHRAEDDVLRPALEQAWSFPYYGAVDSTPQWLNLLATYTARAGDAILDAPIVDRLGRQITLFDSLLAALRWVVGRLDDRVGGGYLWVRRATPEGIANQVWEDSSDSYYHEDGTGFDFTKPYAPVAVQGYVYDALLGVAEILDRGQACPEERGRTGESTRGGVLGGGAASAGGRSPRAIPARVLAARPWHVRAGADVRRAWSRHRGRCGPGAPRAGGGVESRPPAGQSAARR